MITWVLYLSIGIVIGGMAGYYFAKLSEFSKKQKLALETKLQQTEQELVKYKDQVSSHFRETASLINTMTESYQKVHEHLVKGSVDLCNHAVEVSAITVSPSQLLAGSGGIAPEVKPATTGDVTTDQAESEAPNVVTHPQQQVDNNKNRANRANLDNRDNKIEDVDITSIDSHDDINISATHSSIDSLDNSGSRASDTADKADNDATLAARNYLQIDAASPDLSPISAKSPSNKDIDNTHAENTENPASDMVVMETMAVAEDFEEKPESHLQNTDGRTVH